MNAPRILKRMTALALLVSLCSALLFFDHSKAQASTFDKVSPELRQLIQSGQGSTRVKVIVQSSGGLLGGVLDGLVQLVGGVVQGVLSTLNITLVDIQADRVDVLAGDGAPKSYMGSRACSRRQW